MKIAQKYSHMNGLEYLLVHHKKEYKELVRVIESIDANKHLTKESKEKTKKGELVYSPSDINKEFKEKLYNLEWDNQWREFYVSTDPSIVKIIEQLSFREQKKYLEEIKH